MDDNWGSYENIFWSHPHNCIKEIAGTNATWDDMAMDTDWEAGINRNRGACLRAETSGMFGTFTFRGFQSWREHVLDCEYDSNACLQYHPQTGQVTGGGNGCGCPAGPGKHMMFKDFNDIDYAENNQCGNEHVPFLFYFVGRVNDILHPTHLFFNFFLLFPCFH